MMESHLTLQEVAQRLSLDQQTIRRWIKSGKLKSYKPGQKYLIPRSAVDELLGEDKTCPHCGGPV